MNIYVLKGANDSPEISDFLTQSIRDGISRFGWSYIDTADLNLLKNKNWQEMTDAERNCFSKANFLLGIKEGDWVVYVNLPQWGKCIAGQVNKTYHFEQAGNKHEDFRHLLGIDKSTLVEFNRNDDAVLPIISSRLKLQGRYWQIYYKEEFEQTLKNLKTGVNKKDDETIGIFHLKQNISPLLSEITEQIQKTHPASKLEELIAGIFREMPNINEVKENGKHKGWDTDYGADLIVTYQSGLPLANLEKEGTLVIQVKSYEGDHWETSAVNQIEMAIKKYEADAGLIITTGKSTDALLKAIEELNNKLEKTENEGGLAKQIPIGLIAGEDVAKFILKYGNNLIL